VATRVLIGIGQAAVFPVAAMAVMVYVPVTKGCGSQIDGLAQIVRRGVIAFGEPILVCEPSRN